MEAKQTRADHIDTLKRMLERLKEEEARYPDAGDTPGTYHMERFNEVVFALLDEIGMESVQRYTIKPSDVRRPRKVRGRYPHLPGVNRAILRSRVGSLLRELGEG